MKGIILAAGLGTRLYPYTKDTPKPLLDVNNRPIIKNIIYKLVNNNIKEIGIVVKHLPEKIMNYLADGSKFGAKITYIKQEHGTRIIDALKCCKDFINKEEFVLVYGDIYFEDNLTNFIKKFASKDNIIISIADTGKERNEAIVTIDNKNELVTGMYVQSETKISRYMDAGIMAFPPNLFKLLSIFRGDMPDFLNSLISKNEEINYYILNGFYSNINTIDDLNNVRINHKASSFPD